MAVLVKLLGIFLLGIDLLKAQSGDCFSNRADIVFLLDSSTSEGTANFQKQLDFVTNFIKDYDIGPNNVQLSIITFSTSYRNNFYLNDYGDKSSLLAAVQNVSFMGGDTYTHAALGFARENSFLPTHGGRQGVPKIMVVMTDGQSTNPYKTDDEGNLLRTTDIKVISIGIGSGISVDEIGKIATDSQHAFTVPSFDSLQSIRQEIQSAACFTVATPEPIMASTTTPLMTTTEKPCDNKTADIVFVLDASGSEGRDNFNKQLQFVANFTNRVDVGPNNVQISVVTFSNKVYNAFYLNTYSTKADVKRGILNATYVGSTTYTDLALRFVRENSFKPMNGGRGGGVIELIIVLTDGNSQSHSATKAEAYKIHELGIKVISVGIGDGVSQQELSDIATDSGKVFNVKDFDALGSIESQIQSAACGEPVTCGPKPTDIVFIIDSSTSEGLTSFNKQLDFLSTFVQEFDVGPGAVQFGLVTSTHEGYNEFYLDSYHDKAALIAAIKSVRYRSGNNAVDRGLLFAGFYQFIPQRGARSYANKIAIVLTNGGTYYLGNALKEAEKLKNMGVTIISVGIGHDINPYETAHIATDKQHSFTIGSFDILHTLLEDIKEETCDAFKPPPTPSPDCAHKMADIVFVLDSSEDYAGYQKQLDMVRDFVYQFQIGSRDIQVSVVTLSTNVHEAFPLSRYHDRASLERGIDNVGYSSSYYTNTYKALDYVRQNSFLQSKGGRVNASHIVILLTDGEATDHTETPIAAQNLKDSVDLVVAIGIGMRSRLADLLTIASDPLHALRVPDFDHLQSLTPELTFVTCNTCIFLNKADIVFLLDATSSEGALNFQKQLDFVARIVNDLTIGSHGVQIGIVTFGSQPQREFYLNEYNSKAEVLRAIQRIHYGTSSITNTDAALQYARNNMFASAHGDRTDAADYVIVITDGSSSNQQSTLQEASLLKQNHVAIITVGIGYGVNKAELQGIASDPSHEFEVGNFDVLRNIRDDIKMAACTEVTTTSPQLTTTVAPLTTKTTMRTTTTSVKVTTNSASSTTMSGSFSTTTGLLFGCRSENQTHVDPNDCTRYYRCVQGDILHESCPGGNQYFNPTSLQCDLKQNVPSCQP